MINYFGDIQVSFSKKLKQSQLEQPLFRFPLHIFIFAYIIGKLGSIQTLVFSSNFRKSSQVFNFIQKSGGNLI